MVGFNSQCQNPKILYVAKFCKVSADGDVVLPPLEQLSYSALLGGRVMMVLDSYRMLARMSTIALRYAIGRRQFKGDNVDQNDPNALETQLIDYPLHKRDYSHTWLLLTLFLLVLLRLNTPLKLL